MTLYHFEAFAPSGQSIGGVIEAEQEVMAALTDTLMYTYALESVILRARKVSSAQDMATVFAATAFERIESAARSILAACSSGDALRTNLAVLRRFTRQLPPDTVALRRRIATRLIDTGRYVV